MIKPCRTCGSERYQQKNGKINCRPCRIKSDKKYKDKIKPYEHRLLKTWKRMKGRCSNPNDRNYSNYGGRGISVCASWKEHNTGFKNFLVDMQDTWEEGLELDRIDNNGNYEKSNCRWITHAEQCRNTRRSLKFRLSVPDETVVHYPYDTPITLAEFSRISGVHIDVVRYRWARYPGNTDWVLHDDYDARLYEYNGIKYSMAELHIMSGIPYDTMWRRLMKGGFTVEEAVTLPLRARRSAAPDLGRG